MKVWIGCLVCIVLCLTGCDGGKANQSDETGDTSATETSESAQDDKDAMQSLPYAGGSDVDEGEEDGVQGGADFERMQPGYTLYSLHMRAEAKLIDEKGNVVNEWSDPTGRHWDNIELLPNGDLITTGADKADFQGIRDEARYAMRQTWDGKVVWKKYLFCHHDIAAAPNDELITLTFQRRQEPSIHKQVDLRDDMLTRLTMDGEEIESVSLWDTIGPESEIYPYNKTRQTSMGGRKWVDLYHLNSIEWMDDPALYERHELYKPDNVLFCSRHQNRIAVIDMKAKKLIWAWGRDELDGPHDATVLPGGNILVFDNGLTRGWSRVVELEPVSGEIVWQFYYPRDKKKAEKHPNNRAMRTNEKDRSFYTKSKGSSQRLENGNTLICNSDQGEVFEVTKEGDVVWFYVAPERVEKRGQVLRSAYVRAYRYPRAFIDGFLNK